jgi:serine/threonine protein kinase
MNAVNNLHPTRDRLAAFDLGLLSPTERTEVEEHVAACERCCQAMDGLADNDSFVARLRAARAGTPCPAALQSAADTPRDPLGSQGVAGALQDPHSTQHRIAVTPAAPANPLGLPAALVNHPRYRIVKVLGEGGMGVVYKAEHRAMNRAVALKVIHHDLLAHPTARERFKREVHAAASLSHANIVIAYDAEEAGDTNFLIMEYIEGVNLAQLIERKGKLPVPLACHLVRQAALGLQHAHEHGLVHRDIKPGNLIVMNKGVLKILDFGLARFVWNAGQGEVLTRLQDTLGTPDFLAPEQAAEARKADGRSDIYSLGCTLYYCLAGHPPFPGGDWIQKLAAHAFQPAPTLRSLGLDLLPELDQIVARMLAKKPEDRPQTPGDVAKALVPFIRKAAAEQPAPMTPVPKQKPTPPPVLPTEPRKTGGRALWTRGRAVAAAAAMFILTTLASIYVIQTSKGEVVIESVDPDVEVTIKRNGEDIVVLDPKTNQKVNIKAGRYQVELKGKPDLVLNVESFTLERNRKVIVKVTRREQPVMVKVPWPDRPLPNVPNLPGKVLPPPQPGKDPPPPQVAGEMRVNTITSGVQRFPRIAMDATGRFVVIWKSEKPGDNQWDVCGQLFDADGKPRGGEFRVTVRPDAVAGSPQVTMSPNGDFVVAWGEQGKRTAMYFRRFDSTGQPQGDTMVVDSTQGMATQCTSMASATDGSFLIVWSQIHGIWKGFCQRFHANGEPRGRRIEVGLHNDKPAYADATQAAFGPAGDFLLAWDGENANDCRIHAQMYQADSSPVGSEILVAASRSQSQLLLGLACDTRGVFVLSWLGATPAGADVWVRRFDSHGQPLDAMDRKIDDFHPSARFYRHGQGDIGHSTRSDFLVVWTVQGEDKVGHGVYARWLTPDAQGRGEPFQVNITTDGQQEDAAVALSPTGEAVVVWAGKGPGDDRGIFLKRISGPAGKP